MPSRDPHLIRRGAVYHWRRRLPSPVNRILNRAHYDVSLKTGDPSRARIFARRLTVAVDRLAERLRAMPTNNLPTPGQLNILLKDLFYRILNEGEAERRERPYGMTVYEHMDLNAEAIARLPSQPFDELPPEEQEAVLQATERDDPDEEPMHPKERAEWWWNWVHMSDIDHIQPRLDGALAEYGFRIPKDDTVYRRVARDATKTVAAACEVEAERWYGKYHNGQTPPAWIDHDYPMATTLIRTWAGQLTRDEVDFLARTIDDVAEEYIERHLRHTRARKTERDWRLAVRYFVSLVGDVKIGHVTEALVDRFREKLLDVPAGYGKGIYAEISPKKAIEKRAALRRELEVAKRENKTHIRFEGRSWALPEAERKAATMVRKTANKHLSFFTKMWRSRVVPAALRPVNPFAGSLYPKRDVAGDHAPGARTEYRRDELQKLFTSPVWTGCLSVKRRSKSGALVVPDARFWAPLIAIFSGMRREEVCQLKAGDFDEQDGILFLRVQATEGRRLKTQAAARDIPIHSELIRIGLMDFVRYRRQGFLFPELRPSKVDGTLGDAIGKWFNRYRQNIPEPVDRGETDLHALRTTFIQFLRRAGVPLDHIKPISGHQEYDITLRHYAPAFSLAQKKEVIEKFDLGMAFPQLYGRMPELLKTLEAIETSRPRARNARSGRGSYRTPVAAAE